MEKCGACHGCVWNISWKVHVWILMKEECLDTHEGGMPVLW